MSVKALRQDEDNDDLEELQDDLVTDLRETLDEADQWCLKNRPGRRYKECKVRSSSHEERASSISTDPLLLLLRSSQVLRARAFAEAFVICDDDDEDDDGGYEKMEEDGPSCEAERCFEKLVRVDGTRAER